jgi:multidrug efflux pump subunit AcrB
LEVEGEEERSKMTAFAHFVAVAAGAAFFSFAAAVAVAAAVQVQVAVVVVTVESSFLKEEEEARHPFFEELDWLAEVQTYFQHLHSTDLTFVVLRRIMLHYYSFLYFII